MQGYVKQGQYDKVRLIAQFYHLAWLNPMSCMQILYCLYYARL